MYVHVFCSLLQSPRLRMKRCTPKCGSPDRSGFIRWIGDTLNGSLQTVTFGRGEKCDASTTTAYRTPACLFGIESVSSCSSAEWLYFPADRGLFFMPGAKCQGSCVWLNSLRCLPSATHVSLIHMQRLEEQHLLDIPRCQSLIAYVWHLVFYFFIFFHPVS